MNQQKKKDKAPNSAVEVERIVSWEPAIWEVISLLENIQGSRMGSIGSINSHYLPQLSVKRIDSLLKTLKALVSSSPQQDPLA